MTSSAHGNRLRKTQLGMLCLASLVSVCAHAIAPATPDQVLCASDFIVEATIVAARSDRCRKMYGSCDFGGSIVLSARIEQVIASKTEANALPVRASLVAGNQVEIHVSTFANVPSTTAFWNAASSPVTDDEAEAALAGRKMIFRVFAPRLRPTIYAQLYDDDQADWIRATLASPRWSPCPTLEPTANKP
jgi:hypothetical protein